MSGILRVCIGSVITDNPRDLGLLISRYDLERLYSCFPGLDSSGEPPSSTDRATVYAPRVTLLRSASMMERSNNPDDDYTHDGTARILA